jgi:hypothetical protein
VDPTDDNQAILTLYPWEWKAGNHQIS